MRLFQKGEAEAAPDDPWLDDIGRAVVQTSLQQKDYERLDGAVRRFLDQFPDSNLVPAVLRMQARAQLEQNQYDKAATTLHRLDHATSAKDVNDQFLLGMAYEGQRRFAEAIQPLEACLAAEDQSSRRHALALLAVCCARCGRFDEARRRYDEAFANTGGRSRRRGRLAAIRRTVAKPRSKRENLRGERFSINACWTSARATANAAAPWWAWRGAISRWRITQRRTRPWPPRCNCNSKIRLNSRRGCCAARLWRKPATWRRPGRC